MGESIKTEQNESRVIPAWEQFAADFNNMTDDQINQEIRRCEDMLDEAESWIEAVQSWRDAGRPRSESA